MVKIIGLCGYKGAGKTSVTHQAIELCIANHDVWLTHIGFADPFVHALMIMGVSPAIVNNKARWGEPIPEFGNKSMRYLADTLGSAWGREMVHTDLWCNLTIKRAKEMIGVDAVIIDNVRFPNEQGGIWDAGGKIIAFHRNGLIPDKENQAERHVELIQSQADEEFHNTGDDLEANDIRFAELIKRLIS